MHMMKRLFISTLTAGALFSIGSCATPLDLETPRIDSLLTATVKMRSMTMAVKSGNGSIDSMAIANWKFIQDTLYFRMSRTGDPPSTSLYLEVSDDLPTDNPIITIEEFHLRLVDVPVRDSIQLTGDPSKNETGIYARVAVTSGSQQLRYTTNLANANYWAKAKLTYIPTPTRTIKGTVELILQANGNHRVTMITAIEGNE